jgi:hypothetical protein
VDRNSSGLWSWQHQLKIKQLPRSSLPSSILLDDTVTVPGIECLNPHPRTRAQVLLDVPIRLILMVLFMAPRLILRMYLDQGTTHGCKACTSSSSYLMPRYYLMAHLDGTTDAFTRRWYPGQGNGPECICNCRIVTVTASISL